jgi:hypothetical protein
VDGVKLRRCLFCFVWPVGGVAPCSKFEAMGLRLSTALGGGPWWMGMA